MAENEAPQGAEPVEGEPQEQGTDWKAEARKWESRAKENLAAAKANETAAQRLAEIEESQKTEAQKAQEALEQAQRELAETRLQAARAEVAASKGVPVELLSGGTREELEAAADALIAFRGEPAKGPVIPGQGRQPAAAPDSKAEAFGRALGLND